MKILTSKMTPSNKELAGILNQEFSDHYSYKLFGLGGEKSIIVRKSTFVGAQISKRENEITIEGLSNPSIATSFFSFLLPLFLGVAAPVLHLLELFFPSPWRDFENEIGIFLNHKYN